MSFLKMEFAKTPSGQQFNYPMPSESKITLYPILTAERLLAHPKRRLLLEKIKKVCGLELRYYQMCYESLIYQFAELVQGLPFQVGGGVGTLMDYGLERAELILQLYKIDAGEQMDPMIAYVLVIAALVQDVGRITGNQKIMICDQAGTFITNWTPYEGSMVGKGDCYKLRYYETSWDNLGREVTTILGRQIIPLIGFIWIAQENRLLQMLLGALGDDATTGGPIYHWLQLANKRLQNRPPKDRLPPLALNLKPSPETEFGEAFLSWLNRGLKDGTILMDRPDAVVFKLNSGEVFLECPRIFEYFCKYYSADGAGGVKWSVACQQFINTGLTTTPVGTFKFVQYYFKYIKKGSQISYIFQAQNKQRSAFKITGKSKVTQPMIREGLVIPEEFTTLIHEPVITPSAEPLELQPVDPAPSLKSLAEKKLVLLLEQRNAGKLPEQGLGLPSRDR